MIRYYSLFILSLFLLFNCVCFISCKQEVESHANQSSTYQEQHRGQIHFSPEKGWMNDPNGMVYLDGEYHLFYQYYPDSTVWGPMHWGHAISTDLTHWEHLPIALYPDSLGYIFSGSAVMDSANTAGFGKDALVAIYTYHDMEAERSGTSNTYQTQGIAYSTDRGRTFTKYEGNPVVLNPGIKDFRDPKVIWDEDRSQWVMTFAAYDKVRFYTSPNLKDWTYTGEFGIPGDDRLWECPDLFPMIEKESEETKWVLITSIQKKAPNGGTATSYFVGDFDGEKFIGDADKQSWLDYGKDNYAFVTWANLPKEDGRTLGIGWMSNWQYAQLVPTKTWRSAMTLPRSLELHKVGDGYLLASHPLKELEKLKRESIVSLQDFQDHQEIIVEEAPFMIELEYTKPNFKSIEIRIINDQNEYVSIGYDAIGQEYFIDRRNSGDTSFNKNFSGIHVAPSLVNNQSDKMQIIVDRASIELFVEDGFVSLTDIVFPTTPYNKVSFIVPDDVKISSLEVTPLNSIW